MPLTEVRLPGRAPRSRELYDYLKRAILDGTLRPGERLVEESVASVAHTSRTPVREALRKLEVEGLVRDSGRGMVVTVPTADELADLCAVRETLEGMATRLAASSRSEIEVVTLRQLWEESREVTERGDVPTLVALNHAFHETIWQAARNRYLMRQLLQLRGFIERLQETTLQFEDRRREALEEHRRIVEAIVRRDPAAAEEYAKEHFRKAEAVRMALRRLRADSRS